MGITHTVLKSLVTPGCAYIILGEKATEIIPQNSSKRNLTPPLTVQSVNPASTPITTTAATGAAAT
jgi:hypothetical protein